MTAPSYPGMDFFAPLSGPVTQFFRKQAELNGFINIYNTTPHPELEQRILERVGSYGRQLGWIVEALRVLVAERLDEDADRPPSEQNPALLRLLVLADDIERAKHEGKGGDGVASSPNGADGRSSR